LFLFWGGVFGRGGGGGGWGGGGVGPWVLQPQSPERLVEVRGGLGFQVRGPSSLRSFRDKGGKPPGSYIQGRSGVMKRTEKGLLRESRGKKKKTHLHILLDVLLISRGVTGGKGGQTSSQKDTLTTPGRGVLQGDGGERNEIFHTKKKNKRWGTY